MSMNVNSLRSSMRFSGLATGLDTDTMVKDLMRVERMKVDKLLQDKQVVEWRKEQYREMTSLLQGFKREFFDRANPETFVLSPGAFRTFAVSSSATASITATANADAYSRTITIDEVKQLAVAATVQSTAGVPGLDSVVASSSTLSITVSDRMTDVSVTAGMTMREVLSSINASNSGSRISYDSFSGKYTLSTVATGAEHTVKLEGGLFTELGMAAVDSVAGIDAEFVVAGVSHYRAANVFTVDGVTYNLLKTTDSPVTITVSQDIEQAYSNIKSFVDKYNELIDKIGAKTKEQRYSDFMPLTADQRESMEDKEIEQWESKAKSGLLRGDTGLQSLLTDMRRAFTETVQGSGTTLAAIGITTGGYYEQGKLHIDETKLKTALANNGEQVMRVFAGSSDIAYSPNLSRAQRTSRYEMVGIAYRISDLVEDQIRTTRDSNDNKGVLLEKAGIVGDTSSSRNRLDEEIKRINQRIARANDVLQRREDRYYRQFTALEKAINAMNSQSAWLTQQFSSQG